MLGINKNIDNQFNLIVCIVLIVFLTGYGTAVFAKNTHESNGTSEKKQSPSIQDSLSIDSLLKDLDITDPDTNVKVTSIQTKIPGKLVSDSISKSTKEIKALSVGTTDSFKMRLLSALSFLSFFKSFAFFVLLILIAGIVCIVVLVALLNQRRNRGRFITTERLSIMDKEVQRACRFVEDNFSNPDLSIELISKDMVTGPAFLDALFEKELGISVENFIKQVRVNRVKDFVCKDASVDSEKLAATCGFNNVTVMQAVLQEVTGSDFENFRKEIFKKD